MSRRPPSAEFGVQADLDDSRSVRTALKGVRAAYLVTPSTERAEAQQKRFIDLAIEAGVGHLVLLSQLGSAIDSPVRFLRYHAAVELHALASGVGITGGVCAHGAPSPTKFRATSGGGSTHARRRCRRRVRSIVRVCLQWGWAGCAAIATAVFMANVWISQNGLCPKNLEFYVSAPLMPATGALGVEQNTPP